MKHIYLFLSAFIFLSILSGCIEDPDMDTRLQNAKAPDISETTQGKVSASAIELKASILKENGTPVLECGVCWSDQKETNPKDNLANSRKVKAEKVEKGEFTVTISGLQDKTDYYVYAYAINKTDTAFSSQGTYKTIIGIGEVKTFEPDSVKATSVFLRGKLKSKGEGDLLDIGFYLYEKKEGEPSGKDTIVVSYKTDKPEVNINTVDSFVWHVTHLKQEKQYYVRAFAYNSFGDFAFNVDSFTTTDGKPKVNTLAVDSTSYTLAHLSAMLVSKGDSALTAFGFCWSTESMPEIGNGTDTIMCTEGVDGRFIGTIRNLESAKKYYVRAYATNVFGTSYSVDEKTISTLEKKPNIITTPISDETIKNGSAIVGGELQNGGESAITKWGICWSATNKVPTISDNYKEATDSTFTYTLSQLKGATTYYVRAYAINESDLVGYGETQSFKTPNIFTTRAIYPGSNRVLSAGFTMQNQAFIVGGDLGNECTNELFGYNADRNEWITLTSYKKYSQMTACATASMAYIMGGSDKAVIATDFETYNYSDNRWTSMEALIPDIARYDAASFVYRDSVYLLGGVTKGSPKEISKEIWRYDISGQAWKQITNQFPVSQKRGIALVADNKVYAGLGESSGLERRGFWYATDSLTLWQAVPGDLPGNIGIISSGVYYNNEQWNSFFMIDDNGKIWEYNLTNSKWIPRTVYSPRMRNYHMFILNDHIYILGQDYYNSKFMMYDPTWDN